METWRDLPFFKTDTWKKLANLDGLPRVEDRYKAFDLTPFNKVRVVILGQDPYPTKGYANGLAFSVNPHVRPFPASLRNIFTELTKDLGVPYPATGDLSVWAQRGVLLLNTILTVEEGKPLSHANIGWEKLTYEVIRELSGVSKRIVFILWGNKAQEFAALIGKQHHIIKSVHPSPLSASKGFYGSKPFSEAQQYVDIDWKLP